AAFGLAWLARCLSLNCSCDNRMHPICAVTQIFYSLGLVMLTRQDLGNDKGVRQGLSVSRAAVPHASLVLSQLFLTASSHGKGMIVNGGRVQGLVYREKVLQNACRHAIGNQ